MNKFPRVVSKKWKRYNKLEKVFIFFLFFLLILEFFLPIIQIDWQSYSFINWKFIITDIILIFTLVFLILRNISFRVKTIVKSVFNFYENEALVNFWVLFLHASLLIIIKDMIWLLHYSQSSTYYQLLWWFNILWIFLILWLLWNLFLAINNSLTDRKKTNYSKIVWAVIEEDDPKQEVKSLFE